MSGQSLSNFSTKTFPMKPVAPVMKSTWPANQFAMYESVSGGEAFAVVGGGGGAVVVAGILDGCDESATKQQRE